ncbi:MAG: DUF1178 family protein [Pseudomonadota bacterium]
MIRFALRCRHGHTFEAWFDSGTTFDRLKAAGALSCAECGDPHVEKALMAPAVQVSETRRNVPMPEPGQSEGPSEGPRAGPSEGSAFPPVAGPGPAGRPTPGPGPSAPAPLPMLSTPSDPRETALKELRRRIEAVSDNVGRDFAAEARRIHAGDAPERPILGEANAEEARGLIEDDIPVLPLPWMSKRDA